MEIQVKKYMWGANVKRKTKLNFDWTNGKTIVSCVCSTRNAVTNYNKAKRASFVVHSYPFYVSKCLWVKELTFASNITLATFLPFTTPSTGNL